MAFLLRSDCYLLISELCLQSILSYKSQSPVSWLSERFHINIFVEVHASPRIVKKYAHFISRTDVVQFDHTWI